MRVKNLKIQLNNAINDKLAIGKSRHEEKQNNGGKSDFIHSINSADSYRKSINQFADWLRENKQEVWNNKSLSNIDKQVASEFLQYQRDRGLRSTSISRDLAAINKVLNLGLTKKEAEIDKRSIYDIYKSRNNTNEGLSDYIKEKNHNQMIIAQATGCRRSSILKLEKEHFKVDKETGLPHSVVLVEKGGKERIAPILEKYRSEVKDILEISRLDGPIFDNYSRGIDNHSFRAEYAENRYNELLETYQAMGNEIKADYRGFDSEILEQVSQNLGHNRIDVVEEHYINKRSR